MSPLELYDSHCHLDYAAFDEDRDALLERARQAGVRTILVPGVDPAQWARAEALSSHGVRVRLAVGLHPQALDAGEAATERALAALEGGIERLGAAAIGELGWDKTLDASLERQSEVVDPQLTLAAARKLPVILHVVGAHGLALSRLARHAPFDAGGVVHAYSGAAELVPRYLEMGLSISFGPSVTRPNARRPLEAAKATPLEQLLVETDGPDQFPFGCERRRGEPADVLRVVEALAQVRSEPLARIAKAAHDNASRLFGPAD